MVWFGTNAGFLLGFSIFIVLVAICAKFYKIDNRNRRYAKTVRFEKATTSGQEAGLDGQVKSSRLSLNSSKESSKFWKLTYITPTEAFIYTLFVIMYIIGYIGLVYSLVLSLLFWVISIQTHWFGLSFQLFKLQMEIPGFHVVFIAFVVLSAFIVWLRGFWIAEVRRQGADSQLFANGAWPVTREQINREFWHRLCRRGNLLIPIVMLTWVH